MNGHVYISVDLIFKDVLHKEITKSQNYFVAWGFLYIFYTEGADNLSAPFYGTTYYLLKTLLAESQMVAPKSSTVVAPVNTPWMAGPMI